METFRRLYRDVGSQWFWHDRLGWSDAQIAEYVAQPNIAVWEAMLDNMSAGYFELRREPSAAVEIVYFGLTSPFIGRGLGGVMLTRAVDAAWAFGANRVWLHTCTLDSPHALQNYKSRGFVEFKQEQLEVQIEGTTVLSERLIPNQQQQL